MRIKVYENVVIVDTKVRVEDYESVIRETRRWKDRKVHFSTRHESTLSVLSRPLTSQIADLVRSNRNRTDNRHRATILQPVQDQDIIKLYTISHSTNFPPLTVDPVEYLFQNSARKNYCNQRLCISETETNLGWRCRSGSSTCDVWHWQVLEVSHLWFICLFVALGFVNLTRNTYRVCSFENFTC